MTTPTLREAAEALVKSLVWDERANGYVVRNLQALSDTNAALAQPEGRGGAGWTAARDACLKALAQFEVRFREEGDLDGADDLRAAWDEIDRRVPPAPPRETSAGALGLCDSGMRGPEQIPHTRCPECVNWRPAPPAPTPGDEERCPKCNGPTQFVMLHRDGSGRRFFACNDASCGGGVWTAPTPTEGER